MTQSMGTTAEGSGNSATKARRWAMIAAPTVAGILAIVSTVADPLPPATGAELL
jgi:hypothetical protein